jgi:hypothetical protein
MAVLDKNTLTIKFIIKLENEKKSICIYATIFPKCVILAQVTVTIKLRKYSLHKWYIYSLFRKIQMVTK